jgi:hypothetical protein
MTMLPEVCELAQQVAWKEDASPLTVADKASYDFLVKSAPQFDARCTRRPRGIGERCQSHRRGDRIGWSIRLT